MVVELGPLAGLKRSGIYAISVPCVKAPKIMKIGKAKDLRARLDQYQLYYPFGVAIELQPFSGCMRQATGQTRFNLFLRLRHILQGSSTSSLSPLKLNVFHPCV